MERGDLALISMRLALFFACLVTTEGATHSYFRDIHVEEGKPATLYCEIEGRSMKNFKWLWRSWDDESIEYEETNISNISRVTETDVVVTLEIANVTSEHDRAIYKCSADAGDDKRRILSELHALSTFRRGESDHNFRAVGTDRIYIQLGQSDFIALMAGYNTFINPSKYYCSIEYSVNGTSQWQKTTSFSSDELPGYHVIHGLRQGTTYRIHTNIRDLGSIDVDQFIWATTFERDIEYVPVITIIKVTTTSVEVEWTAPPRDLEGYINKYRALIAHAHVVGELLVETSALSHVFHGLYGRTYVIRVEACSIDHCQNHYLSNNLLVKIPDEEGEINPTFIPTVSTNGSTNHSITIRWTAPEDSYEGPAVHYYHPVLSAPHYTNESVFLNGTTDSYTFLNLQQSVGYQFHVEACGKYRKNCGNSSIPIEAYTLGGPRLSQNPQNEYMIVVGIWLIASALILIIVMSILAAWTLRKQRLRRKLIKARLEYFNNGNSVTLNPDVSVSDQAELLPYVKKYEFPRSLLTLGDILGSGAFGVVRKGQAQTIRSREVETTVAVKTVRATASLDCMMSLLRELRILCYLEEHLNLVCLLGACTKNLEYGQLFVIVEFCRFGNLHDYLLRHRRHFVNQLDADTGEIRDQNRDEVEIEANDEGQQIEASSDDSDLSFPGVTVDSVSTEPKSDEPKLRSKYPGDYAGIHTDPIRTQDLVCWAWQVSRGMQYLSAKKVLHGDLAARNILLSDNNVVKICDFGLSKSLRDEENLTNNEGGPLPVKWMAIESLRDRVFSTKSDVWSYGIVLWELFSLGNTPYYGIRPHDMCQTLADGYRMERPKYAPQSLYDIMSRCWKEEPSERPSFDSLAWKVGDLIDEHVKLYYLELGNPYTEMYAGAWKREREIETHGDEPTTYEDTQV
ncbi:vascular endothelial growth factor receptor 3-like [Diprion similis]|uniref:vascular endothelial growth factor receptor 3-like n=1 Tax=Diprion similis TaxID=362088 RepID=UPI001EF8A316|nr:vascular endothelial growth factor receptor 3-like [Diprion similis]